MEGIGRTLAVYRLRDTVQFLGLPLLGAVYFGGLSLLGLLLGLISVTCYLSHIYGFNNWWDRSQDSADKNVFAKGSFSGLNALLILALPVIVALAAAAVMSRVHFWMLAVMFVLSAGYSAPPLRLKSRKALGFLTNALLFAPLFFYGISSENFSTSGIPLVFCIFFAFNILVMEILQELQDVEEDKHAGINSIPNWIGVQKSRWLALIGLAVQVVFAFVLWRLGLDGKLLPLATAGFAALAVVMCLSSWGRAEQNPKRLRIRMRYLTALFGTVVLVGRYWAS